MILPKTKLVFYDEVEFEKVIVGINKLHKAVAMTLGPRSRAVLMDRQFAWNINKDGISVAKSIYLEDPIEQSGLKVVREASQKTVDDVGDGTSVTIILAHALIKEASKLIASGIKPMALREPLERRVKELVERLDSYAIPVETLDQKVAVATISASGDEALGKLIAETLEKIGNQGVLTVEDTKELETRVEFQEGLQFDKGMAHPLFVTDPTRNTCTLENVPVLITDKPLKDISEMAQLLDKVIFPKTKQLVIISPEISGNVLPTLLENKLKGNFMCLPINAPYVGSNMRDFLQDLCAITNARFISSEAGMSFNDVTFEDLGKIPQIVSTKNATIITGSDTKTPAVQERIALTKRQMEEDDLSEFDKEKLKERLGKLTQGIAVLKLGGSTKVEMEERKERAIDAIAATQAAIRSGIVPGGETIYLQLRRNLKELLASADLNQQYADTILSEALKAPFYTLLSNSGLEPGEWISQVKDNQGVDVTTGQVVDMIKEGILDPVEVVKSALLNSLSVSIQILTLGCVVAVLPEETK